MCCKKSDVVIKVHLLKLFKMNDKIHIQHKLSGVTPDGLHIVADEISYEKDEVVILLDNVTTK